MESLTELISWGLLAFTLYIAVNRSIRVDKLNIDLNGALGSNKIYRELIIEKNLKLEEYWGLFNKALENAKKWEKLSTCPPIQSMPDPIVIYKNNLQKICIKTEIGGYPVMREKAIREGIDKLTNFISPMVYSEFITINGTKYLYQEIWVGLSENFKDYEKGY